MKTLYILELQSCFKYYVSQLFEMSDVIFLDDVLNIQDQSEMRQWKTLLDILPTLSRIISTIVLGKSIENIIGEKSQNIFLFVKTWERKKKIWQPLEPLLKTVNISLIYYRTKKFNGSLINMDELWFAPIK